MLEGKREDGRDDDDEKRDNIRSKMKENVNFSNLNNYVLR